MNLTTTSGRRVSPFGKAGLPVRSARELARVGVVDVGSNSIRLVVFDGAAGSPAYFYNEKIMAGLGQGLAKTGTLNPDGVRRGMAALTRFAALARGRGIETLTCVATAAVREAADGPAFHRAVERQTGLTDVVGRWMRDLVPDHEQHWFDLCGRVALTGEPVRVEQV